MPAITAAVSRPADDVALLRLYLLRAGYALMAGGMGSIIVPAFLHHKPWAFDHGVMDSMLLAMVVLAVIGLRYPLKMLPLIFWEMAWKIIWLTTIAYPAWRDGTANQDITDNLFPCSLVAIFLVIVPWGYVWRHYVKAPGDRLL